jgi:type II secretory pathway pseudopilin PulG
MRPLVSDRRNCGSRAFTLLEVTVSSLLIALAMGSILMMSMRASKLVRASRQVAATSQMLQQRVEMVRERTWSEVAGSRALAALMETPTDSEAEMAGSRLTERLKVTVPKASATGLVETARTFTVSRSEGGVVSEGSGDFGAEPTLLFEGTVTWSDSSGVHQRVLRTVICRFGLTRSGIVGTVIGRPTSRVSSGQ